MLVVVYYDRLAMDIEASQENSKIVLSLGETESWHLMSILLHAKFSDDPKLEIAGSPTMRSLLEGLMSARNELGFNRSEAPDWNVISEKGGLSAPPAFRILESDLKSHLGKEDVTKELEDYLFPFKWIKGDVS